MATPQNQQQKDFREAFFTFSGVQSAANAFVEVAIPTGVSPDGGFIVELHDVFVDVTSTLAMSAAAATDIDIALTRATKTAIPLRTDRDVIAKWRYASGFVGAATAISPVIEMPINVPFEGYSIVASDYLYLQLDSTNFTTAFTFSGRIYYTTKKMSKTEILDILYG